MDAQYSDTDSVASTTLERETKRLRDEHWLSSLGGWEDADIFAIHSDTESIASSVIDREAKRLRSTQGQATNDWGADLQPTIDALPSGHSTPQSDDAESIASSVIDTETKRMRSAPIEWGTDVLPTVDAMASGHTTPQNKEVASPRHLVDEDITPMEPHNSPCDRRPYPEGGNLMGCAGARSSSSSSGSVSCRSVCSSAKPPPHEDD